MSNLSNIGFDVEGEKELYALAEQLHERSSQIKIEKGSYFEFSDESGAQLWIQINKRNKLIGVNPHFGGKSRRRVAVIASIDGKDGTLDGAFHSWADPTEEDNPESGSYPFVFELPDYKLYTNLVVPQVLEIQLTAFTQGCSYYASEEAFSNLQDESKWASRAFVPSGLFTQEEDDDPEAYCLFAGIIKEVEIRKNAFTKQEFYWMLVDTLGGMIDVVADLRHFEGERPRLGGVIYGEFWLSGRLLTQPQFFEPKPKGFFKKIFGG